MNAPIPSASQAGIAETAAAIRAEANIGKLLQEAGKLQPHDLERVLKLQQDENLRFGEAAQRLGLVTEADIREALSQQFEYPYVPVGEPGFGLRLAAASAPYGKEAEALRSVRAELLLRWFKDGRKTLAVGSARADEGASLLAANLAVLFAQMGQRVLLIDADMRTARQQDIFTLDKGMGLSDILAGRVPSVQVRTVKPFQTLSILPAGSPPPNPAELLARPAFGALLAGLESSYDVILVDTTPSQIAADFQLVAARVGGMLIATRRNVGRLSPLVELKDKIVMTGAQIVGAVVLD
ncbi:MAG: chain length determinant protein tyrosine kinase EpsG [Thiobacillus sp. 65-69]|nr:chain length determinant protein tyrosine kinase EpsG [Thiobacillus sp.]ODU88382.1 MAG: chain length determinant protein tyrosine kinase EpsG [Thiobacillus sp. SCN 65-179]OJW36535.1 MAG: chain length determinant protein tyrosine kinase EpsG [Thiobacillus sp. 65-69]